MRGRYRRATGRTNTIRIKIYRDIKVSQKIPQKETQKYTKDRPSEDKNKHPKRMMSALPILSPTFGIRETGRLVQDAAPAEEAHRAVAIALRLAPEALHLFVDERAGIVRIEDRARRRGRRAKWQLVRVRLRCEQSTRRQRREGRESVFVCIPRPRARPVPVRAMQPALA